MADLPDFDLHSAVTGHGETARPPEHSVERLLIAALFATAVVAAAYIVLSPRPLAPPAANAKTGADVVLETPPPRALGGTAADITVPPLDQSDNVVRRLVRALSAHPVVAHWLTTAGLVRNFTVIVVNIANGTSPARSVAVVRPSAPFRTIQHRGHVFIDTRSYDRYDAIADAVASLDPAASAQLYATLKPRIQEAYRDLGFPDELFDRTIERAIVTLLNTPVLDGPVPITPKGIGYAFADERLERLSGAQKHLLRMGPRNVRIVKTALRGIAIALGIPPGELPSG